MLNLLNFFFEDVATDGTTDGNAGGSWLSWLLPIGMIVLMVVIMIIPQRKQKKAQEEMKAKLGVGVTVMTIGGIIGTIVKMDAENFWLETGLEDNKCVLQFTARAIHSIVEAPATSSDDATTKVKNDEEEVVDEIK